MGLTLMFGPIVFAGGLLLGAMRRPDAPSRFPRPKAVVLDALVLFFLSSVVCDGLSLMPGGAMQLMVTPYALASGFAVGAWLRIARTRRPAGTVER
jgi:hypothetical protein